MSNPISVRRSFLASSCNVYDDLLKLEFLPASINIDSINFLDNWHTSW